MARTAETEGVIWLSPGQVVRLPDGRDVTHESLEWQDCPNPPGAQYAVAAVRDGADYLYYLFQREKPHPN